MHNKFLGTSLSDISGSYSCDHSVIIQWTLDITCDMFVVFYLMLLLDINCHIKLLYFLFFFKVCEN